ncbi:MAG: autotransporter-associated beta strand repeat-containing protein [Verrucomicrobium sp.]
MTINTGGTLRLWIQNNASFSIANNLTIDGGTLRNEDGNHTMSGTILVNAGGANFVTQWNTKNLTLSGVISGTGAVRISSVNEAASRVIMTATNTYTGGTTVASGTLQLGTDPAFDKQNNGYIRGAVTVSSGATLLLNATNAFGYSTGAKVDSVTLNGGTLTHAATGDNGWGITYTLTGALMQGTNTGAFTFGGNSGGTGTSVTTLASANSSTINGRIRLRENNVGNTVVFNIADGAALNDLVVNAVIETTSSAYGITKTGAGVMILNGVNTLTGSTVISGGTLALSHIGTLASSPVVVNNTGIFRIDTTGKTLASLTANTGSTLALTAQAGATTTITGALTLTDAAAISISPIFRAPVTAGTTIDLITAGSITGTGTLTTNFNFYGQSRIAGTTSVVGNIVRLNVTTGAASLTWNNAAANGLWDIATSANFNNGGSNDTFMSYDAVTFDNSAAPGNAKTVNLVGTVAPTLVTVNNATTDNYTFTAVTAGAGQLTGAGSLVKDGAGTLTLGANMGYNMTGSITVNAGTFDIGSKALTNISSLVLNGGALNTGSINALVYDLRAGSASTILTGLSGITKTTAGTVTLSGANTYTGVTTVNAGTLILTGSNTATTGAYAVNGGTLQVGTGAAVGTLGTGAVTIASGGTVLYNRSDSGLTIANVFSGAGALNFTGTNNGISNGTSGYILSGSNTALTGTINIINSRLTVDVPADLGTAAVTIGTNGQFYFSTAGTFTNNFTISGNGWGETAGVLGAIRLSNGVNLSGTITLSGDARIATFNATNSTLSGAIVGGNAAQTLTFGAGGAASNITLSGVSTYTSATSIFSAASNQATTVNLTGSLGNTAVTVSNFSILTGEGTIGAVGGTGSLTMQAGSFLNADLSTTGALTVNGTVTFSGATSLNLGMTGIAPGATYTILNHTGVVTGLNNLAVANASSFRALQITDSGTAIQITLGNKALTWTGSTNAAWDLNTTTNWVDGTNLAEKFFQGDAVTFIDGAANAAITITGALTPSSVTFNNSTATTYTITSSAGNTLGGSAIVQKFNTGTAILIGPNTYTGGTLIRQGTLVGQNATAFGTGVITLGDASTVAGTLALYLDPMTLGANISISNAIVIGAVSAPTTAVIGTLGASVTQVGRNGVFSGTITLNDDVILRSGAHDQTTFSGAITGGSALTITVENGLVAPSNATATQFGAGQAGNRVILTGDANGFTGNWNIKSGTSTNLTIFQINADRINNNSNVNVEEFAVFRLNGAETINVLTGSGRVRGVVNNRLLTVGAGNGSGTFSGVLENDAFDGGSLSFAKSGTGTQILTGTNTYTGSTAINGGTLQIGDGGSIGTLGGAGAITMGAGATLIFNRAGDLTLDRTFTGATTGTLIQNGSNILTISGTLLPNNIIVNSGTLTVSGGLGFDSNRMEGNGSVTINTGGTLIVASAHALGGGTSGMSESVVVNGTGRLVLSSEQYLNNLTLNNGGGVTGGNQLRASNATNWRVTGTSSTASVVESHVQNYYAANWTVDDITGNSNVDLIVSGNIVGGFSNGALNKAGLGTMELTGTANTYTMGTNVNAGTLLVNNSVGSGTGTGQVTVAAGATLAGKGSAIATGTGANITINGRLSVGNVGDDILSDLNLNIGSSLGTVFFNGVLAFDIFMQEEPGAPTNHGQAYGDVLRFETTNAVVLGGQLEVSADPLESTAWDLGDSWQLIDWTNVTMANVTGSFSSFVLPELAEGLKWDTSLIGSTGYISVIVVPEPSRMLLVLLGAVVCVARRKRRHF